jgi:hypothetical protein
MTINTQIFYSDMTSDMETEAGESTLNCNIYIDAQGVMPSEKAAIKKVLDQAYKDIRAALYAKQM